MAVLAAEKGGGEVMSKARGREDAGEAPAILDRAPDREPAGASLKFGK